MTISLYELAGIEDERCFSPYVWRARLALAHKGLEVEGIPVRFTEKDKIAFAGSKTLPVLVDDGKAVADSWRIACHLEDAYGDRPSLFGGPEGRAFALFVNEWSAHTLGPALAPMILADVWRHVHECDRDYFRTSREARLGATLEEIEAGRDDKVDDFRRALEPVRASLSEQPFLSGEEARYPDYIVFSMFQWARCISRFTLLDGDDPVYAWRGRMLALHDGLAAAALGYPV